MKITIKLTDADSIEKFVNTVSKFDKDVNLYVDSKLYDAKSIMTLMGIDWNRELNVELVDSNENNQVSFIKAMEEFR